MTIHFYLRYHTKFGQSLFVSGNSNVLGKDKTADAIPLSYFNDEFWFGSVEISGKKDNGKINYRYILREEGNVDILDGEKDRIVDPAGHDAKEIIIRDTWNVEGSIGNVFYTKPFVKVLLPQAQKTPKLKEPKSYTHEFKIKAPLLHEDEWVCITGSGNIFKNWDIKKLLPLKPDDSWYSIKINVSKEDFPVRYKYGIYNTKSKTFNYENSIKERRKTIGNNQASLVNTNITYCSMGVINSITFYFLKRGQH